MRSKQFLRIVNAVQSYLDSIRLDGVTDGEEQTLLTDMLEKWDVDLESLRDDGASALSRQLASILRKEAQ